MKRPMAVVGLTYLAAQIIAVLCGFAVSLALAALVFIAIILCCVFWRDRPRWLLAVLLSAAAAFGTFSACYAFTAEPARALDGQDAVITGTVVAQPYSQYGRWYYVVRTQSVRPGTLPQSAKVRISSKYCLDAEISDAITAEVTFNRTEDIDGFSTSSRLLSDGITATGYVQYGSEPQITAARSGLRYSLSVLRGRLTDAMDSIFPRDLSALLAGMSLSDTSGMDSRTVRDFRLCGLSHLLAVSGLHLSILLYAATVLLRALSIPPRVRSGLLIGFVVFYMALVGFSASITRAGLMTILALIASMLYRDNDPLNSFGTALLIICLCSPFAAADISLLLSASATLGLILLHKPVAERIDRRLPERVTANPLAARMARRLISAVVTTLLATLFTLPFSALYFGEVSIIAPVTNVLCALPASVFMVFGSMAALLSMLPLVGGVLGGIVMVPAWLCGKLLLAIVRLCAALPNAGVPVGYDFLPVLFAFALLLAAVWLVFLRRRRDRAALLLLCLALALQAFTSGLLTHRLLRINEQLISVYNVEDGVLIALRSNGRCVLLGAGGDRYLAWRASTELSDCNITRADALFIPGAADEYAANGAELVELFRPTNVFLPDEGANVDEIAHTAAEYDCTLYRAANASCDALGADIAFSSFTGRSGELWTFARTGNLSVLLCPTGGDCDDLPAYMRRPDCAVLLDGDIANLTQLGATAVIISSSYSESADLAAVLRYRGVKAVLSTGVDGTLTISAQRDGIRITGDA